MRVCLDLAQTHHVSESDNFVDPFELLENAYCEEAAVDANLAPHDVDHDPANDVVADCWRGHIVSQGAHQQNQSEDCDFINDLNAVSLNVPHWLHHQKVKSEDLLQVQR